jgi:hypothetical protein
MFPSVTFATAVWERDWRHVLLAPNYLSTLQINHHCFPFAEKLLIINNVANLNEVKEAAQNLIDQGILTRYIVAQDILPHFQLQRSEFNDWQYYNALAPLSAIYECKSDYLLYLTGDVYLKKPVNWLPKTLRAMGKNPNFKVANLTWNDNYSEAKKESSRTSWNFYIATDGFSDQMFLVRRADFQAPIYREVCPSATHYPRGDVFEKRVYSFMKARGWKRLTYRHGSYTHENVQ